jgi:hypothetical protein
MTSTEWRPEADSYLPDEAMRGAVEAFEQFGMSLERRSRWAADYGGAVLQEAINRREEVRILRAKLGMTDADRVYPE